MPRNFGYNNFDNRKQFERLNSREHDANRKSEIRIRIEYRKKSQVKGINDLISQRKSYEKDINKYIGRGFIPDHIEDKYFKLIENVEYSEKHVLAEIEMKGPLQDMSLDTYKCKLQKDVRAFETLLSNLESHNWGYYIETNCQTTRGAFERELRYTLGLERPESRLNRIGYEQKYITNEINNLIPDITEALNEYRVDSEFSMRSLSNELETFRQAVRIAGHAWSLELTKIKACHLLDKNKVNEFKDAFDNTDNRIKIWNGIWMESTPSEKTKLNEFICFSREPKKLTPFSREAMDGPNLLHLSRATSIMRDTQQVIINRWDNIVGKIENDIKKVLDLHNNIHEDFKLKKQMIELVDNYLDQKRISNPEPMRRLSDQTIGSMRKGLIAFRRQEDHGANMQILSKRFDNIISEYNLKEKLNTYRIVNIDHEYLKEIIKTAINGIFDLKDWYSKFEYTFRNIVDDYQHYRYNSIKTKSLRAVIRRIDKINGENTTNVDYEKFHRDYGIRTLFSEETEEQDYDLENLFNGE